MKTRKVISDIFEWLFWLFTLSAVMVFFVLMAKLIGGW